VTVIVTEDLLFVIDEFVLLLAVPLVVLLDVLCDDVVLVDLVFTVEDELLDVVTGGGFDVELFVPVPVPFELWDGGSMEKAYCGKIKIAKNEKKSRDLVFM
jgi:hypothetical protein